MSNKPLNSSQQLFINFAEQNLFPQDSKEDKNCRGSKQMLQKRLVFTVCSEVS